MQKTYVAETTDKIDQDVTVKGWVHSRRDHGKLIFIDLRDSTGLLQVVFHPQTSEKAHQIASSLSIEDVISIKGKVNQRPEKMQNPEMVTGTVELGAREVEVISEAETPPFEIDQDGHDVDESIRLKYRYLDLRRDRMQKNLKVRHRVSRTVRNFLDDKGFTEIETPYLSKTTPEGARDFIVPSRLQPGEFYALAQAPQQYKQMLMISGFEKYYQLSRAFRDEDLRADRQFEHTQIDLEMSFVDRDDVLGLVEEMLTQVAEKLGKKVFKTPFPVLTYKEAQEKYQADKFDLRDKKDEETLAFAFVVDFPLFEKTEEGGWTFSHNPFTSPRPQDVENLVAGKDLEKLLSLQYDVVCNGFEIASGSIRITEPAIQAKIFEVMGYSQEEIKEQFGHLLDAYKYGAPSHGGVAIGLDRLVAIIQNETSIREVIAFPISASGQTSVMDAPSQVGDKTLKDLGLKKL